MISKLTVKKLFTGVFTGVFFLLVSTFTCAASGKTGDELLIESSEKITTMALNTISESHEINIYGMATPFKKINIPIKSAGIIEIAPPLEGTEIKSGEVILSIESMDYKLNAELAENQMKAAAISNNQAENENKRISKLYEANATTAQNRDNVSYANQISRANLNISRTQVKIAEKALKETKILAPDNGIISVRYCESGEYIDKGNPAVELLNIDVIKANMKIPEQYINNVKIGQNIEITTDGCGKTIFSGHVCSIIPTGDSSTHTFSILAFIDNTAHKIKPGMFLKGKLKIQPAGDKIENIVNSVNIEKSSIY